MQSTNGAVEISDPLKDVIRELNQPQTARALVGGAERERVDPGRGLVGD